MGKLMEGKSAVKRETVSASANLEVVSEEKFAKRLEGISSSCMNCQKERGKGQRRHSQKGKRKQVKTNTPIVIHLKDSLKAALQQRQRSLEEDSEASIKSGDSELSHDQEDIVTCVPKYSLRDIHKDKPRDYKKHHHSKSKKKDNKNLNALISVIEKAHLKDSRNIECNLAKDNPLLNSKLSDMLNNATRSNEIDGAKRRSIVECENVDLICNDLYNTEKQLESLDDTESDKSSVASSSENYSVSDSDSIHVDDSVPFEFTPEELEKLANYTTGFPLIRYDCPPSECPECLSAWYSYQYYTIQNYSISTEKKSSQAPDRSQQETYTEEDIDIVDIDVLGATAAVDPDKTLTEIDYELETDEEIEFEAERVTATRYQKTHRQLWDIDISSQRRHKPDHSFPDSVYIDLTGTDVSLSVYYHHNQSSQDANYASSHGSSSHGTTWYPPPQPMPTYYWPPSYYQLPLYSHHHLSSPFIHSNSSSLPKTAMVPPRELKKFNASAPPPRQWIPIGHPERNKPAAIFTVMCYNVLCDKYCTRQQYGYCPSWALNWEYRKKGIMDEIRQCNADIISLQEVETDQFYNMFLPELKQDGYDGIFSPKSRARTMTEQERKHVDGCAIFFRTSKFSLIKEQLIEFNQLAMANAEGHDDMLNRVMTKDNIGLAALLETKEAVFDHSGPPPPENQTRQPVLVATAHIHWDPEFSDVKLIQTMMLMSELRQVIEEASHQFRPGSSSSTDCNNIPLILCGDLNSLPDSGVVEYLTSGKVAANHEDFKEIGYDSCLQKINPTLEKETFSHNFKLARAYNEVMPYTNYTYDFKGIIDYIFFARDHMNLLGILGPLEEEWFRQNKVIGCPHPHIPSDHFSLFVEFEMPVGGAQNGRSSNSNNSSNSTNSNSSSGGTTGKPR